MSQKILIDDSWVMSRAGHFSPSFSSFLSQITLNVPEAKKERVQEKLEETSKQIEKMSQIKSQHLEKLEELDRLGVPIWVKPFVSKIVEHVQEQVSSSMAKIANDLFGAGIFSLSEALYDVAKERGITNEGVLRLIRTLPEFEAFMYFLNVRKYYRDHCAHQLRVAVLGDFLLDLTSKAGDIEGVIKDKFDFSSEEVRTAWWFAGLLHDTGIPLAKLCTSVNWSLINEILRCYPSLDIQTYPISLSLANEKFQNVQYLSVLLENMPERWQKIVKEGLGISKPTGKPTLFKAGNHLSEYQPEELSIDHGVVGAVNLLSTLGSPEKLGKNLPEDRPLIEAAKAICLHNFKNELGNVPFEDSPLAFLLIFVDELQEWSRPVPVPLKDTYFATSLQKVALVKAISCEKTDEIWDIPYTNIQAKRLAKFDFKRLCKDKKSFFKVLDCTEQFPESEVQLRDVKDEKTGKEDKFSIQIETKK